MKHFITAKLKAVRHHGKEAIGHGAEKFHIIEAKNEDEAREKLDNFYKKKGEEAGVKYALKNVDIEPTIK